MDAPTHPSEPVPRFGRTERAVHWTNAVLFAVLFATAAILYVPGLSVAVGRRETVKHLHVYAGLALPVPIALGLLSRAFRRDVRRLASFDDDDRRWMRGRGARLGKFNPGQKLNASFVAGSILVMLMTGSVMRWFNPFPIEWRTGATFVHDLLALALAIVVAGHIVFALRDRDTLRAMILGWIPRGWAERNAPKWIESDA